MNINILNIKRNKAIGKAMKEGKIVYKDIFDHKGPILFFIQMIGQYICDGRFGIFLLQILALFISNIFLYKSACFFTTNKKALLSIFDFLNNLHILLKL